MNEQGTDRPTVREAWGVFLILFFAAAYFHQGGGWNQNARFNQIRAIVENGDLEIDDYLFYVLEKNERGEIRHRRALLSDPSARESRLPQLNGLDIGEARGHYYPNPPPGMVFLGVPVYFVLHLVEGALGVDPDEWKSLTLNLYLTTVLTVALFSGLGGVVLFRVASRLFPDAARGARLAAALTLGLGTLCFPFATMLFDHVPVAALSLLAFALIRSVGDEHRTRSTARSLLFLRQGWPLASRSF